MESELTTDNQAEAAVNYLNAHFNTGNTNQPFRMDRKSLLVGMFKEHAYEIVNKAVLEVLKSFHPNFLVTIYDIKHILLKIEGESEEEKITKASDEIQEKFNEYLEKNSTL